MIKNLFFFFMVLCVLCTISVIAQEPKDTADSRLQMLADRNEIIDCVNSIGVYADRHDWAKVMGCFANEVILDYTSLVGGNPIKLTPEQIVNAWKALLPGFKMTQHSISNHRVNIKGAEGECFSYVTAVHYLPNKTGKDIWVVMGYYDHHLLKTETGWKVDKMKFTATLIEGNNDLPGLAKEAMEKEKEMSQIKKGKNEVVFLSNGSKIKGHLYIPDTYEPGTKLPAIVFDGPMTGVKEQVTGIYAKKLAAKGFITLAFDHRFFGESEGEPREYEAPSKKVEDISCAVTYLTSLPQVDPDKVGGMGICAGGGYMSKAVSQDKRIHALVTVAGFYHDPNMMKNDWLGEKAYNEALKNAIKCREVFEKTGKVDYIPSVDKNDKNVAMPGEEAYEYYGTNRGFSNGWKNRFAVMSFEDFLQFNAINFAKDITVPTLVIHSPNAIVPQGAKRFYDNLGSLFKEIYWINTKNHIDLYDREEYVNQAIDKAAGYFIKSFMTPSEKEARRRDNYKIVEQFFVALEQKDIESLMKLLDDKAVQIIPFSPEGFPKKLEGKEAIYNQFKGLPQNFTSMKFPRDIQPMLDPDRFLVRFRGEIKVAATGKDYNNIYCNIFTIQNGKIIEVVEHFDPIILLKSFGDPESLQKNFNVK